MTDEFSVVSDHGWRVTVTGHGDDLVIRLHIGDTTVILPALEAHKLGSALHAVSGIDTADTVTYPDLKPGDVIVRSVGSLAYEVRRPS